MADTSKNFRTTLAADIALRLENAFKGIAIQISQGWKTVVVAKHRCYPPEGALWTEISSSEANPDCCVCPECTQHFRKVTVESRGAPD